MIKRFDLHTHTHHSDGQGSIRASAEQAAAAGLSLVAVTDHFAEPLPHRMDVSKLTELHAEVRDVRHILPVLLGVETGIEGTIPPELRGQVDLVIRSVHYLRRPVQAKSVYDPDYWEAYKEEVLALLRSGGDVLGHLEGYLPLPLGDLITTFDERRSMEREIAARFFTTDWQEEAARLACKNGVAVELHCATRTPRLDFIRLCKDAGCLFSVGSDAHIPDSVGRVDWAFEIIDELKIPKERLLPYARGWLK